MVDATIINAPSSTKNAAKERNPEMRQTKKGNQWFFGMKGHFGVDKKTKLIHSVAASAANMHDSNMLPELLHGQETHVWGDSAYAGQSDLIEGLAPAAKDLTQKRGRCEAVNCGQILLPRHRAGGRGDDQGRCKQHRRKYTISAEKHLEFCIIQNMKTAGAEAPVGGGSVPDLHFNISLIDNDWPYYPVNFKEDEEQLAKYRKMQDAILCSAEVGATSLLRHAPGDRHGVPGGEKRAVRLRLL